MPEPESPLDRLRRLDREATPGPWMAFTHSPDAGEHRGWIAASPGSVVIADMLTDDGDAIVTLRNHTAEIIEAFELLSKVRRLNQPEGRHASLPGVQDLLAETRAKVNTEVDALLSKVNG